MLTRWNCYRMAATLLLLVPLAACGEAPAPAAQAPSPAAPAATEAPAEPAEAPTAEPEAAEQAATPPLKSEGQPVGGVNSEVGTSGVYASDLGFRADANGFGFPNYGGEGETNMTPNDVRRMFGDSACESIEGDECTLTPPGAQWLESMNSATSGGHCEGMAVLSNLFYTGKVNPADFGAETVPALQIAGNEPLQREIAYWFATQATQPARSGIVPQTPSGVVNTLLTSFAAGPSGGEQYAVGIYKRDRSGGHAVTPYAVEDRGEGVYWIMIYDNNYPGEPRAIEVNTSADTWSYSGSTNPAEQEGQYEGDAETMTLELAPIAPRLGVQDCPFCAPDEAASSDGQLKALMAPAPDYNQVWLEGPADLLISDAQGHSIGFKQGVFVNDMPGAQSNANKFGVSVWETNAEPIYYIPVDIDFTISIDGSRLTEPTTSTVTMIGPGYALDVSEIVLAPGDVDTLDVSPDGSLISYRTQNTVTPYIQVAVETDAADYLFGIYGEEMAPGEALNLALDTKQGWLSLDSIDNAEPGSYSIEVAKYDDASEQIFGAGGVVLEPDDVVYIDYLKWPGNNQPMALDVDYGGDGSVDETLEVADITDSLQE
ncbi:hypothetical protein F8S13_25575 [Chloroflexia bacterium SDU3-3]|nr:hypothetical protein F8S13_25575 [Chloroflexia bacterium SDU3-3]